MWRTAALACGVALGVLVTPSVSSATPNDPRVTVLQQTYVDGSRPSPASDTQPAAPDRTLVTTIAYPSAARGRLPLVVLAHGSNGNPDKFTELIQTWARAGYVVAAPLFPRSSDTGGNLVGDYVQQPRDVSFVLDHVLAADRSRTSPLHGRIDPRHIGLAGLSLGGFTTYGTIWNSCCRDRRFDAALLMSAILGPFPNGSYDFRSVPALLVHGDADGYYPQSPKAYPQLARPKWFVTLHGGQHATPFENTPDPNHAFVRTITTEFWNRYLKGDTAAEQQIVAADRSLDAARAAFMPDIELTTTGGYVASTLIGDPVEKVQGGCCEDVVTVTTAMVPSPWFAT